MYERVNIKFSAALKLMDSLELYEVNQLSESLSLNVLLVRGLVYIPDTKETVPSTEKVMLWIY
jgi:hypothetical protein